MVGIVANATANATLLLLPATATLVNITPI